MSDSELSDEQLIRKFGPFVHMAPLDVAIWLRWLRGEGAKYAPYVYDRNVGNGIAMPAGSSELETRLAYKLTTKRIDALSYDGTTYRIFEAKPRAGLSAVGQLLGYGALLIDELDGSRPVELWLITDELQPDMQSPLRAAGIIWREVGR